MLRYLCFLLVSVPLLAVKVDPSTKVFQQRVRKERVDVYDFKGEYPDLERVDIDGVRKKNVVLSLSGNYPLLKSVVYDGGFGILRGELTGNYPELTTVDILCGDANMHLDLRGQWHQNCTINITGIKENIAVALPNDVGVIVHTSTKAKGKVLAPTLQKQGKFKMFNKTFHNALVDEAPVTLIVNIGVTEARVTLQ